MLHAAFMTRGVRKRAIEDRPYPGGHGKTGATTEDRLQFEIASPVAYFRLFLTQQRFRSWLKAYLARMQARAGMCIPAAKMLLPLSWLGLEAP